MIPHCNMKRQGSRLYQVTGALYSDGQEHQ